MRDRTGGMQACLEHGQDGRATNPGVTHFPVSIIGRCEPQKEGRVVSMCHGLPINSAAHTTPYRLSIVAGGKMDQFADSTNRKSQIANLKSPDGPITSPLLQGKAADLQNRSALHRLLPRVCPYRSAQHGMSRRVYPSTDGPHGGVKPPLHQLALLHQAGGIPEACIMDGCAG